MVVIDVPALGIEPKPRRITIDQFILQVAFGVFTTTQPLPASRYRSTRNQFHHFVLFDTFPNLGQTRFDLHLA
jgi:hypothetical protein